MYKWNEFNENLFEQQILPEERRYVLLQIKERLELGLPACVVVGYLRYSSGKTPYFVCPGLDGTWSVTFWCDCLGDDFNAPYWNGKQIKNKKNIPEKKKEWEENYSHRMLWEEFDEKYDWCYRCESYQRRGCECYAR